jgi:phosphatidylserine/phosphatidylglycerophosphate/cardiolipin synthase-like enzyme
LIQYKSPAYSPLPLLTANGALYIPPNGTANVQISRTFSYKYKGYTEFAPQGERSLFHSRLKAIRQAKNYIFIEDQYFIQVPELLEALIEVLPRLQRLVVVVQRTPNDTKITGYEKYLFDMVAPLQRRFPNKFQLFTPKASRKLYLHSKIVVIDDVFLSIGSANWNRRSMTSDSEMAASVVDKDLSVSADGLLVTKTAKDFRVRKFMEYTGKSYAEMDAMPFLDAANALDEAVKDPTTLLEVLEVEEKATFAAVTELLHQLADPDDSC